MQMRGVRQLQADQSICDGKWLITLRPEQIDQIGPRGEVEPRTDDQNFSDSGRWGLRFERGERDIDGVIRFDLRVSAVTSILIERADKSGVLILFDCAGGKFLEVKKFHRPGILGVKMLIERS